MTDSKNSGGNTTIELFSTITMLTFLVGYWFFGKDLDGAVGFMLWAITNGIISLIPFVGFPIMFFERNIELNALYGITNNSITAIWYIFPFIGWVAMTLVSIWVIFATIGAILE